MANSPAGIARTYARAAFALATEDRTVAHWSEMLGLMAALADHSEVAAAIADPGTDRLALAGVLTEVAGSHLDQDGGNFLRLLLLNRRTALLPLIEQQFQAMVAAAESWSVATVASARALTAAQEARLKEALELAVGHTVRLDCRVNVELVGGAMVRVGDLMIDGSAVGRLRELARSLR